MTRTRTGAQVLLILVSLALAIGCGDDKPSSPSDGNGDDSELPGNMPEVPIPTSPTDLLPAESAPFTVGLSSPIETFAPFVEQLRQTQDDGTLLWLPMNRRLVLACEDVLPCNTNMVDIADATYIRDRPRLMHTRHWRKIKQVTLDPGTSYSQQETITYGTSTSHAESQSFSRTIGVDVTVGGSWGPFAASVSASFEETATHEEVSSVTFSEENTFTETYSVESRPAHTRVYVIWQLVDRFTLVDADTIEVAASPTVVHARLSAIPSIEFPNRNIIYQSVTEFD